jgi:lipopolysaccharide/colanic/teichoic acid biosynthesis glycosyltransferase
VRLTTHGRVAGIRRLYCDCAELASVPDDWPSHIFIKTQILSQVLTDRTPSTSLGPRMFCRGLSNHLPQSFSDFLEKCKERALILRSIRIGGSILDLETEYGLLSFCRKMVGLLPRRYFRRDDRKISASKEPRLVGQVLLGKNVEISPGVIVIGPAIISDNVRIGQDAVINSSIVGPEVRVPQNQLVDNCIVKEPQGDWNHLTNRKSNLDSTCRRQVGETTSRTWPGFSYAGCFKRLADCFTAIVVLILFAPIIPFIAIAIKLSSPGAVFFKDRRQGLHGRFFNCLKFRTMLAGADKIQDKLRAISQVDGPQFKIQDDPRLSAVGRFLRDTYIDEIPQFINVLLGQMSVVGPRPSPESENTLCPSWRDARLSVRPGITGLWQVCRTRRPMQDFQEWIYYDVKYVKNLSLRMDLWICRQTAKKMFGNFIRQF